MMASDRAEFDKVLRGVRGDNPDHIKRLRKERERQAKIDKAAADNKRRRGQQPRAGSGRDDVIDTGMFG
jgi:hypothetical protein